MKVLPGYPYPLGSRYDGNSVNFSIFSELTDRVELCLFGDGKPGDMTCSEMEVNVERRSLIVLTRPPR